MTSRRAYETTHPWISFRVSLERAPARLWLLLGEAISKCEHISNVPLKPQTARELHRIYLAKGVHATTAIEGNTLSEQDVRRRIEGDRKLPPSKAYLGREVDNVLRACNDLILKDLTEGRSSRLDVARIKLFNRLVLSGLSLDDAVVPGEIRGHSVCVGRYRAAPAEDCEFLLERLCDMLNEPQTRNLEGAAKAIVLAIIAHLYIAWIHPFGDGNGRTARLVEFQLLVSAGLPMPAAHLLSDHYNQTRSEYYRQLDHASRSKGEVVPFVIYAVQGLVDGLRTQIEMVRFHQWEVAWQNFVHEAFGDSQRLSAVDLRRLRLVLDLSDEHEPVPYHEIANISPRLAKAYAGRTSRTLSRDLSEVVCRDLVKRTPAGYRAAKEQVLAFLPLR